MRRRKSIFRMKFRSARSLAPAAEDWDEGAVRARAAEETERAVEDAQPGRAEEAEIQRSRIHILAVAFPEDEPMFALPVHSVVPIATSAAVSGAPQVVLKIRRRKFNQQQFHARGNRGHTAPVPLWRQRIPAQRKTLPAARYSGTFHGHGSRT